MLGKLSLASLLFALCAAASCSSHEEPVSASIETRFTFPRGVLDKSKKLELRILEGEAVACDEATGLTTGDEAATEVAKSELGTANCTAPAKFCGSVQIEKSAVMRTFVAKAKDDANAILAVGCHAQVVDQDAVPIALKMFRFLAPSVCGDNQLQPTEQCDPSVSGVCDAQCLSTEVLLTLGAPGNSTATGKNGDKTDPNFLWPSGSGDNGRFLAFYTDHNVPSVLEVGLRVMADTLLPVTSPPALAAGAIFMPNGGAFPPQSAPGQQSLPQAAFLGGSYYVVFQDDASPGANGLDIHLRAIDKVFASSATPITVNGVTGEANIQTAPSIAASSDRLLVVWEDQTGGKIVGRTLTPPTTLGNQNDLSTGNGNSRPQIAATGKTFVTVWKSGTGIKLRAVNSDGTPSGGEQGVNQSGAGADSGHIASLPDGRFAVVWSAGGDVFIQRYNAKAIPNDGDQAQPLNDVIKDGDQIEPVIASTPALGGSYVVAWNDTSSGHIRARLVGGDTGFHFNNVNGQTTEFQASRIDGRSRSVPAVAVGGSGPFIAIGWQDKAASNAGILVRRFPLPVE